MGGDAMKSAVQFFFKLQVMEAGAWSEIKGLWYLVFVTFGMSFASSKKIINTGKRFVFIRKKRIFSVCRVLEPPYVDQISGNYKIVQDCGSIRRVTYFAS